MVTNQNLLKGKSLRPVIWKVVTTDASLLGQGAVIEKTTVQVVKNRKSLAHQHPRASGSVFGSKDLDFQVKGLSCQDPIRHWHSCGLYQSSRGHQESLSAKRGEPYSNLGRKKYSMPIRSLHSGNRELAGELLKSPAVIPRGMVSSPQHIFGLFVKDGGLQT